MIKLTLLHLEIRLKYSIKFTHNYTYNITLRALMGGKVDTKSKKIEEREIKNVGNLSNPYHSWVVGQYKLLFNLILNELYNSDPNELLLY